MEKQLNALCVSEVRRLTFLFNGNKDKLVSLYKNYPDFIKMYDQFSSDKTGDYTLLVNIIGVYVATEQKLLSGEQIIAFYKEYKNEFEAKNKSMEAKTSS